jgi:hypothetical protein
VDYTHRKLSARYPTDLGAWQALKKHYRESMRSRDLGSLFSRDKDRAARFTLTAGDLTLDYSKNHVTATTRKLLARLAKEAQVPEAIEAMFAGDKINVTENRSVLHAALRAKMSDKVALDVNGVLEVWETLNAIEDFVERVQTKKIRGHTGKRFTDVVNIGIGGSDLGPVMAARALRPYWHEKMRFHSVSNIDGTQLADLTQELSAESTLFVVCSKTFTTQSRSHGCFRHPSRVPIWLLGLGRGALLAVVGGRAVACAGGRHGHVPASAERWPGHGPAFPECAARREHAGAAGADRGLVQQFLRGREPGDPAV